jgi:hypothetical protein
VEILFSSAVLEILFSSAVLSCSGFEADAPVTLSCATPLLLFGTNLSEGRCAIVEGAQGRRTLF